MKATVSENQTGLSRGKLKAGDEVEIIKGRGSMVLVEKGDEKYWIDERFLIRDGLYSSGSICPITGHNLFDWNKYQR